MRVIHEVMTRREAAATRRPELMTGEQCVIIEPDGYRRDGDTHYWAHPFGSGTTTDLERAALFTLSGAVSHIYQDGQQRVGFIKAEPPKPGPDGKVRRVNAKLILGSSLFGMVQARPNNPTVRAHVMAKVGRMPADELDTDEKIIDWIECDVEFPGMVTVRPATVIDSTVPVVATPPPANEPALVVETTNTETELGRCNYSVVNTSKSRVPITRSQIIAWLGDELEFDEMVDAICNDVEERASEYERDHEQVDYEYSDYEATDSQDRNIDYNRRQVANMLGDYLRTQLTREEMDSLGL